MIIELYLMLLISSTLLTILLTELVKKLLVQTTPVFRTNAVVLDASMISCTGISILCRVFFGTRFSLMLLARLIIWTIHTWFMATLAYDKIKQTREQYRKYREYKTCAKYREYEKNKILKGGK